MDNIQIQSQEITELAGALSVMQHSMRPAKKSSENPFFKASYADLVSVWDAIREPLFENGLSISQTMMPLNGKVMIVTTLFHTSGQWIRSFLPITPVKDEPQALGSAITYGRRYSLAAIVGLVTEEEDDDGGGAMARDEKPKAGKPKSGDELRTDAQGKKIYAMCKNIGVSDDEAKEWMRARYKVESSKELTKKQASDFIEFLTEIEKQQ